MPNKIGNLTIGIAADIAALRKDMAQSNKIVKGSMDSISRSAAAARRALGGIAAGVVSAASLVAISSAVKEVIKTTRELKNLSSVANTSVQDLQRLAFAADRYGVSQEKVADILKDTSDKVGDFLQTGGGPLKDFFDNIAPSVGVTAEQFKNLSGKDALELYVSSLDKANLSQNEMTFFMEAIASDATLLLPLLKDNASELGRLSSKAEKLGVVLSDVELRDLEEAKKATDDLEAAFTSLRQEIAIESVPAVKELSKLLTNKETLQGISDLAQGVITLTSWFVELGAAIPTVAKELAEFSAAKFGAPDVSAAIKDIESLQLLRANLANSSEIKSRVGNQKRIIEGLIGFSSIEELEQYLQRVTAVVHRTTFAIGDGVNDENDKAFLKLWQDARGAIADALKAKKEVQGSVVDLPADSVSPLPPLIDKDFLKEQERQLKNVKAAIAATQPPLKKYSDSIAIADSLLQVGKLSQSEYNNALTIYKQRLDEATGANKQWNEDVEDATRFAEQAKTEIEKLEKELEKLYSLAERRPELISAEAVKRNAEDIKKQIEEIKKESDKTAQAANDIGAALAQGMQDVVSDGFVSIWKGGFDDVLANFGQLLIDMTLEAAAADVVSALGFGGQNNKGGNLKQLGNALFSFEGGGYTGSGSRTGGLDGRGGFLAMVHPNETVVDHTKGQGAGGVTVVNHFHKVPDQREANRAAGQIARGISNGVDSGRRYT